MIFVVLGMHKSGTSLVARSLHEAGIDMGSFDDSLGYDEGNKTERHEFQEINRELLAPCLVPRIRALLSERDGPRLNAAGHAVNSDSQGWVRAGVLRRRLAENPQRERMRAAIAGCEERYEDWGFKDPRSCLTYPAWRELLPEHRVIAVYRPLSQVLQHYKVSRKNPIVLTRVVRAWLLHNRRVLDAVQSMPATSVLTLSFERIMASDAWLAQLGGFVGRHVPDVREPGRYRNRVREVSSMPLWMRPILGSLSEHPMAIEAQFQQLMECSPVFVNEVSR